MRVCVCVCVQGDCEVAKDLRKRVANLKTRFDDLVKDAPRIKQVRKRVGEREARNWVRERGREKERARECVRDEF